MKITIACLMIFRFLSTTYSQNPINATYSNEPDGVHTERRSDGSVRCVYKMVNGNLDSIRNCYHKNGALWNHEVFNQGKFNGTNYSLTENGDTIYIELYKNDTLLYTKNFYYFKKGAIKQIHVIEYDEDSTLRTNPFKYHRIIGGRSIDLKATEKSISNKGSSIKYYPKGTIKASGEIINGEYSGIYIEYFESGKIKIRAEMNNGAFHGEYFEYNNSGETVKHIRYKEGKKVKQSS